MKLNMKDLLSGVLLVTIAALGIWLNTDHTLGSARRMGPGYMPLLALGLLAGLGAAVMIISLFSGPDPLPKWTRREVLAVPLGIAFLFIGYYAAEATGMFSGWYPLGWGALAGCLALSIAPGWRPVGLVHAGLAAFGLMLGQWGLMLALTGCVIIASFAEPHHRVKGVIGMILFLCVLCYLVFIYYLEIRVPVWPVALTQ